MLIKGESIIINSNRIVYVLVDTEKGIGEIGIGNYGESPITKLAVSPENAIAIQNAWFESWKESEIQIVNHRPSKRRPRKAVKKGVRK